MPPCQRYLLQKWYPPCCLLCCIPIPWYAFTFAPVADECLDGPFGLWDWELSVHFPQEQAVMWPHNEQHTFSLSFYCLRWAEMRAQRSSTFNWGFLPFPTCTEIYLDSLNLFKVLCIIVWERPKLFVILHWEMWFWICLTFIIIIWNEIWYKGALLVKTPFIPKYDPLTCYQFTCLMRTVSKQFNQDII